MVQLLRHLDLQTLDRSTTIPGLSRDDYDAVEAYLPPVPEQIRIVEAIDSYSSRLDEAEAALERVQRNLKRYRAAVLQAAVEGRLVATEAELARAEGRAYEPASELLRHILAQRRGRWQQDGVRLNAVGKSPRDDKWKAKYSEPPLPAASSFPPLPEGWCWASLSALTTALGDVDHRMPRHQEEGIPYVSTRNFVGQNDIDFTGAKLISHADYEQLSKRIRPELGDILISRYGTVGIVRIVATAQSFLTSYSIAIAKPVDASQASFIALTLRSELLQAQMRAATRASAQPDLGLTDIRRLAVPLPPLREQDRLVAEVERLASIISDVESIVQRRQGALQRLRQSILKWAFEGKLVDQDPNDEPASVLLERIRAERATRTPSNGKKVRVHNNL